MTDDDYGYGVDSDGIGKIPPYIPINLSSISLQALARCNRCGSIVEGDTTGTTIHDIWHTNLDERIRQARTALPVKYR